MGKAKLGRSDKLRAIQCLDRFVRRAEEVGEATVDFEHLVAHERAQSQALGGRTATGPPRPRPPRQLELGLSGLP